MPRGGARPGAGRKRGSGKQLARLTGEQKARDILDKLGWEEQIIHIYQNCGEPKIQLQILIALQERAWGKPATNVKKPEPNGSDTPSNGFDLERLLAGAIRKTTRTPSSGEPN